MTVRRLGRWIDFEDDYKTLDPEFMESVWWVFRQLFDKGLVYKGFKVSRKEQGAGSSALIAGFASWGERRGRHFCLVFVFCVCFAAFCFVYVCVFKCCCLLKQRSRVKQGVPGAGPGAR